MAKKVAKKKPVKKARSKTYEKSNLAINGSLEDVLKASLISAKDKQGKK